MDLRWGSRKVMRHVREYKGEDRLSSMPDDLHLWLSPIGDADRVLSMQCLTCLPALRNLRLTLWDFRDTDSCLSLPELITLRLTVCKMPNIIWNLPALKTLMLQQVDFPGNLSEMLAALVSLQNLKLHLMSLKDCNIRCPQLINLKIETRYYDTIEGNIVVVAPKLTNFTSVGIFPITFGDSKLDNVYVKLRGWIDGTDFTKKTFREYYQRFLIMLPGLGSAKILNLQLETIEALSSISDFLVSCPSPFNNLKYVKLPHGFKEASLTSTVRSYLLDGSPTATIVATVPQNIVPHAATASMTARNVVIEETLAAPTKLVDSKDRQKTACIDTVDVGVQDELVLQNSEVHADRIIPVGAPVKGTCNDQVSSSRRSTDSGLWQGDEVNSDFVCLLDQIMNKYPETFEHLATKNKKFRTMKLNMLCTVVNDFTQILMTEVDAEMIVEYRDVFADLKKLGFNVSWLVNRLNYIEQLRFSQPLPTKFHLTDCHDDDGKSEVQDMRIHIDDVKSNLQDLQTLGYEKMQEIQKAHGTMDTNLVVGCIGYDLLSGP
ncbi:hypothetical protein POM88_026274 [Heracleum sosnowskyi]|uniref:Uncharacterized protein n=1 Tax=Heracleum sosnowskyi TaxID=360622 RepID=A0AAD8MKI7_9APIA|nr:hypothetical protein POM88_026274 [Heracleum sosnowskyi]